MKDQREIYLSDLWHLALYLKRPLLGIGVLAFILSFAYLVLNRAPVFKAQATFQQASNRMEDTSSIQSLIKSMRLVDEDSKATALFQSRRLLGEVVQKLGLQVEKMRPRIFRAFQKSEGEDFVFRSVLFKNDRPQPFILKRMGEEAFAILDLKQQILGTGQVGEPFVEKEFRFILNQMPASFEVGQTCQFTLKPLHLVIAEVKSQLKVKASRLDGNVLDLSFTHEKRRVAEEILTEIMSAYQRYLLQKHMEIAQDQLAYLKKREQELNASYDLALFQQMEYIKKTLGEEGFIDMEQKSARLAIPSEEYQSRLHELDLEYRRWQEIDIQETAPARIDPQFMGIDLPTAQKFYSEYSSSRDNLLSEIKHLMRVTEEIERPDFELSALSEVLKDNVSQERIQKAANYLRQLCEPSLYTTKELDRIKQALESEKRFLLSHVNHSLDLAKIKLIQINTRMGSLQLAALDLIQKERLILNEKLEDLKQKMADLPEKWRLENQLKFKKELAALVMEGVTQLSESKVIDHHLFAVESKPLDFAFAAPDPEPFRFVTLPLLTGVLAAFFFFVFELIRRSPFKIPVSIKWLKASGREVFDAPSLGKLAHAISQFERGSLITFLIGSYPSYTQALCELLEERGFKILFFNQGTLLQQREFSDTLAHWKEQADYIFLEIRTPLDEEEAMASIRWSEGLIVSIGEETFEELQRVLEHPRALFLKGEHVQQKAHFSNRRSGFFGLPPLRKTVKAEA